MRGPARSQMLLLLAVLAAVLVLVVVVNVLSPEARSPDADPF